MAPGNQSLYIPLSLKISGIIKPLSLCVCGTNVRVCVHLFVHARGVHLTVCVVFLGVCVWEGWTVTEIDGEGKAGHYIV